MIRCPVSGSGCAARKKRSGTAAGLSAREDSLFVLPPKCTARRKENRGVEGDAEPSRTASTSSDKGKDTRTCTICSRLFPALVSLVSAFLGGRMQPLRSPGKYSPPVTACLKKARLYETFVVVPLLLSRSGAQARFCTSPILLCVCE